MFYRGKDKHFISFCNHFDVNFNHFNESGVSLIQFSIENGIRVLVILWFIMLFAILSIKPVPVIALVYRFVPSPSYS